MKTKIKFLLIGLSSIFLAYISFYTIPEVIIITNIFILVGAGSTLISYFISPRNTFKWLNSSDKSDKTKNDD